MKNLKPIPYGKSDFEAINAEGRYYIDKTAFIPALEAVDFNFLLRPRRFGKSLLLSTLQSYYDVNKADRFEELYKDTWILNHPTADRGRYMVLYFNFSAVEKNIDRLQASFESHCTRVLDHFVQRYESRLPAGAISAINSAATAHDKLDALSINLNSPENPIYVFIDEYDNFTNTIISEYGSKHYEALTHGSGAFRDFFSVLKAATSGSGSPVARIFITGVSPVTMDDVTSGFNIGSNISHQYALNACCGFVVKEVEQMLDYYIKEGGIRIDKQEALDVLGKWAGGYRFSDEADEEVYNSDLVLYFIQALLRSRNKDRIPKAIIDPNIRTDYGKLRNLVLTDLQGEKTLNGNFSKLKLITDEGQVSCELKESFPNKDVAERDNFLSLIYHLGFLTRMESPIDGFSALKVPNESMQSLLYEFVREGLKSANTFAVDMLKMGDLMRFMAYHGKWQEVFAFIAGEIQTQSSVRDYVEGEKLIQGFMMAYLNVHNHFCTTSERELNKGYSDLVLLPSAQYPDAPYSFILELKYIPRTKGKVALNTKLKAEIAAAQAQITRYAADQSLQKRLCNPAGQKLKLACGVMVFHGWEMIHCEPYELGT